MEIELDTQEIYEKIYDFLLEKGLTHTAFVLKNEAKLHKNFDKNENQSSLFTIYAKGKIFEQYEVEDLQDLDSDLQSVSNQGFQNYVDQRILKSYNYNHQISKESISVKKPSIQSIQESDKKTPLETFFKYLIYDCNILGYDRNSQQIYFFNFVDEQARNLKSFKFGDIKGKFYLFKHLCISQKHQVYFVDLETFTFQKQISINEDNQLVQIDFYHNKYILTTNKFTLILDEQLQNECMIPKKIKKVVASVHSLYIFSNEENLLYEYQIAHKRLLQVQLPKDHYILNCSANISSNLLVVLSQNQENQNIYSIYHEGQEEYLIQWRIKKFLSKIKVFQKQMIIFDDQTFHHCDFTEQQVKFRHSFKNHQIEDIFWIDQSKILIQLAGNIFKKFDLEDKSSINIEKTSYNYKILYSEKIKKLVEIENPDMFSIINLQSKFCI